MHLFGNFVCVVAHSAVKYEMLGYHAYTDATRKKCYMPNGSDAKLQADLHLLPEDLVSVKLDKPHAFNVSIAV